MSGTQDPVERPNRELRGVNTESGRPNYSIRGVRIQHADHVRHLIAIWLLAMLTGTIASAIVLVGFGHLWGLDVATALPVIQILFTAVVTLVSSAVGFYYGQKSKETPPGVDTQGGEI